MEILTIKELLDDNYYGTPEQAKIVVSNINDSLVDYYGKMEQENYNILLLAREEIEELAKGNKDFNDMFTDARLIYSETLDIMLDMYGCDE